jgi:amino acid transporter
MGFVDLLFGKPLADYEDQTEKVGVTKGIPIFGLDALGSAAYGPEAALTLLIPLGVAGIHYILPITIGIVVLLTIVCFSYLQTIPAYPSGGGSYIVASQNLGPMPGLFAASALMIDYVLTVAVGISAGIGALVSAFPELARHTLPMCLATLVIITLINLRGVRETGVVFMIPTYLFIACIFALLVAGFAKVLMSGGHPMPVVAPLPLKPAVEAAGLWLLLKAFSSGCTAMTGVEAVSNGVTAFKEPRARNAQLVLGIIIAILIAMLLGIAALCRVYGIGAVEPASANYQSVLSQLIAAVTGKSWFYYLSTGAILAALAFQANTAFADFPRLCRSVANDGYLPFSFANRGRRLVYSEGIYALAILSLVILILFGGVTDRLIPLYAVGAFTAFTLSQAGMVLHWRREGGAHARHSMWVNGIGASVTAVTTLVVMVSKFAEGAWVVLLLMPAIAFFMRALHRHFDDLLRSTESDRPLALVGLVEPIAVVPFERWNRISQKAMRFALTISKEVVAVHVRAEEDEDKLGPRWKELVEEPARRAGIEPPKLVMLQSPYRHVIAPIFTFITQLEQEHQDRHIAVLIPNLRERRWFHNFLHNQRAELLTALLLLKGNERIVIVNVPWYVKL